jgi:Putative peptidoglycan binding domain
METLAYLHHALAHETLDSDIHLCCRKLNSLNHIARLLTLTLGFTICGLTNTALALQRNDSGSDVKALQSNLAVAGYFNSPTTDFYGELTEEAVRSFQKDNGLIVDGVAGSETLAILERVLKPDISTNIERSGSETTSGVLQPTSPDGSIECIGSETVVSFVLNFLDSSSNCESVTSAPRSTDSSSASISGVPREVNDEGYQLVAFTSAFNPSTQDLIVRFKPSDSWVYLETKDTHISDSNAGSQNCTVVINSMVDLGRELSIGSDGRRVLCLKELLKTAGFFNKNISVSS